MTSNLLFDPFAEMPFNGYLDPTSGEPTYYRSLAHFVYSEMMRSVDPQYQAYLIGLDDSELFRLEVEDVALGQASCSTSDLQQLVYAGVYMQAASNKEAYSVILNSPELVSVQDCELADDIASVLGRFISDLQSSDQLLRVAFMLEGVSPDFLNEVLSVLFKKRAANCILAVGRPTANIVLSDYARGQRAAFLMVGDEEGADMLATQLQRRTSHVYHLACGIASEASAARIQHLESHGVQIKKILENA